LTQVEGEELKLVATDGRRLAVAQAAIEKDGMSSRRAIVPTKGMQLFCQTLTNRMIS